MIDMFDIYGRIELLMDTAVSVYNNQYKTKYKVNDFLVRTVQHNGNTQRAYEMWTRRPDDDLIIRLYCFFGDCTRVHSFKLLETSPDDHDGPNKKIFECYVQIEEKYPIFSSFLLAEDGVTPLLSELGIQLTPEMG